MTDKQNYFTYTDNTSDNNDKIMENLHKQIIDGVEDMDVKQILKLTMNKMTNPAKRQMISEMLNQIFGNEYLTKGNIFQEEE